MRFSSSMKALGLGEIGGARPVLDGKPVDAIAAGLADDAARAAGDLGDGVRAEVVDDLVERALDGRQRGELLDQLVAPAHGLAAVHRVAVLVDDGARERVALGVGVGLEELRREASGRDSRGHIPAA